MLKFSHVQTVFYEIPDETSLAFVMTLCPNHCVGCHSPEQRRDEGTEITKEELSRQFSKYGKYVTTFLFMGGDNDVYSMCDVLDYCKNTLHVKTAVYSGLQNNPILWKDTNLDYLKLGPYISSFGPLTNKNTNQKLYRRENSSWSDITWRFW